MKEKISFIGVLVNLFLSIGKITIGTLSKSSSVLADGVHSGVDVFSSLINLFGIKAAQKPVDEKHPYGHYKIEVLTGLVITIIVLLTGVWIIYEAYQSFISPEQIVLSYFAFGVMIFSAVVNEIMARLKIRYGKEENSISLISDGVHSRVDVYTSVAILVGLIITPYWMYADSLFALLVGLYIIKESLSLGRDAIDSLLDVSAGKEIEEEIRSITEQNKVELSGLKTQKKGSVITANIEINLPENLNVKEATKISNNLKKELIERIENLQYVAIQIESHDFTDSYFNPVETINKLGLGKGFGWQRKGKFKSEIEKAEGRGPGGDCACSKCNYKEKHQRGVPCSEIKCPRCGTSLERK